MEERKRRRRTVTNGYSVIFRLLRAARVAVFHCLYVAVIKENRGILKLPSLRCFWRILFIYSRFEKTFSVVLRVSHRGFGTCSLFTF